MMGPREGSTMAQDGKQQAEGGKVDRRVVRTRTAIVEAYLKLLMEKEPGQITVSAIAREARVDRKTFYAHFGSIDGLLDFIAEQITRRIADTVEEEYARATEELSGRALREERTERCLTVFFEKLNEAVRDNVFVHQRLAESMTDEEILERIRKPLEREMVARQVVPAELADGRLDWSLSYFLGGIIAIYRKWAVSDGETPLEEVSEMARAFTMNGLSCVRDLSTARDLQAGEGAA